MGEISLPAVYMIEDQFLEYTKNFRKWVSKKHFKKRTTELNRELSKGKIQLSNILKVLNIIIYKGNTKFNSFANAKNWCVILRTNVSKHW